MAKKMRVGSPVYVGYLFLLLGFVLLGSFVAALATGSDLAIALGVGLAVALLMAVVGFRVGAIRLAKVGAGEHKSIWSQQLSGKQIDQYLDSYRDGQSPASNLAALPRRAPMVHDRQRLSA